MMGLGLGLGPASIFLCSFVGQGVGLVLSCIVAQGMHDVHVLHLGGLFCK